MISKKIKKSKAKNKDKEPKMDVQASKLAYAVAHRGKVLRGFSDESKGYEGTSEMIQFGKDTDLTFSSKSKAEDRIDNMSNRLTEIVSDDKNENTIAKVKYLISKLSVVEYTK